MSSSPSRWVHKLIAILGCIILLIGVASLVLPEFSYTTHEQLIELGPIHATKEIKHELSMPSYIGIITVAIGLLLGAWGFLAGKKK
jgi:hypothetical protein